MTVVHSCGLLISAEVHQGICLAHHGSVVYMEGLTSSEHYISLGPCWPPVLVSLSRVQESRQHWLFQSWGGVETKLDSLFDLGAVYVHFGQQIGKEAVTVLCETGVGRLG